jgi:hypothetical protein
MSLRWYAPSTPPRAPPSAPEQLLLGPKVSCPFACATTAAGRGPAAAQIRAPRQRLGPTVALTPPTRTGRMNLFQRSYGQPPEAQPLHRFQFASHFGSTVTQTSQRWEVWYLPSLRRDQRHDVGAKTGRRQAVIGPHSPLALKHGFESRRERQGNQALRIPQRMSSLTRVQYRGRRSIGSPDRIGPGKIREGVLTTWPSNPQPSARGRSRSHST